MPSEAKSEEKKGLTGFRFRLTLRGLLLWLTLFAAFLGVVFQLPLNSTVSMPSLVTQVLAACLIGGVARAFSGSFSFACLGTVIGFGLPTACVLSGCSVNATILFWPVTVPWRRRSQPTGGQSAEWFSGWLGPY